MKIRNKKTGEVIILIDHIFDNYDSLEQFNKEWEEAPAEHKRYRLLKDLPTFKAGDEFYTDRYGSLYYDQSNSEKSYTNGLMAYHFSTIKKFPNILNDWFEEIKPAEPLIKNEALRKLVLDWTREGNIEEVIYDEYWRGFRCENSTITIWEDLPLEDGKTYTIEELCGEEYGRDN